MEKLICIYDNHFLPNIFIKNIVGDKTFGEIILKRKTVKDKFNNFIKKENIFDEVLYLDYEWQLNALLEKLKRYDANTRVLHIFSNFLILNEEFVQVIMKKLKYIEEDYVYVFNKNNLIENIEEKPILFMKKTLLEYCSFIKNYESTLNILDVYTIKNSYINFKKIEIDSGIFFDISLYNQFLKYISGGFDTRFFNSVKGDNYIVTKKSKNKQKIKSEYKYYYLLPEGMRKWFVMPYNYNEYSEFASYEMERYHVTDLAIRWVHGAITLEEFTLLLERVFYFITHREIKKIEDNEYEKVQKELYIIKVKNRIADLKSNEFYKKFESFIKEGTKYKGIDDIINKYLNLYEAIVNKNNERILVIGHGDLCFSNMLYNKELNLLKLIDPKGALEEKALWTDTYYDIAKLSHSICGRYDFFNNNLYHIILGEDLKLKLEIDFDNSKFIEVFKIYLKKYNFDFNTVRLYEVSLFLSMLPLHMDNPHKVFGFILNAIQIMEDLERCLKN